MRVGVMGARGSFSEMAGNTYIAHTQAKDVQQKADIMPLISAENVLQAVEKEEIDVGILQIENANG